MAYWANKQFGILFGGVTDDDKDEETLESTFYNELFGYSTAGNGRWVRLMLKQRKKMGGTGGAKKKQEKRKAAAAAAAALAAAAAKAEGGAAGGEKIKDAEGEGEGDEGASDDEWDSSDDDTPKPWEIARARREMELAAAAAGIGSSSDPSSASGGGAGSGAAASGSHVAGFDMNHDMDDPEKTVPGPRYNPMCAVLRNTLYLYGGILEAGNKEYTLCDFHTLDLSKMDRYTCLRDDRMCVPLPLSFCLLDIRGPLTHAAPLLAATPPSGTAPTRRMTTTATRTTRTGRRRERTTRESGKARRTKTMGLHQSRRSPWRSRLTSWH